MADLNNTIVRGQLRVTEDINANGNITGNGITLFSVKNAGILGTDSSGKVYNNSSAYQPKGDYVPFDNASKDVYLGSHGIYSGARPSSGSATLMGDGYWIQPSSVGVSSAVIGGGAVSSTMTPNYVSVANGKIRLNSSGIVSDSGTFTFDGNPGSVATSEDLKNYQKKGNYVTTDTVQTITGRIDAKLDKTTYEWNKEFAAGSNGAISLGRYNIYDSQLTFDITSTTNQSISGKLVIATQNGTIHQAKVFGDATGALVSKLIIYQSAISNSRSWVEVFCNFNGWSKNKVHIYAVALNSATVQKQMTSVTISNGVPAAANITSGDTKWTGTIVNDFNHSHSNYVTTNTKQSITGQKTFDATPVLSKIKSAKVVGTDANGLIEAHTLAIGDITNLQPTLNEKASKSDVPDIIKSTLKKKNKIYVLSSVTLDTGIYQDSGNRKFADKSAVIQLNMSEPGDSWATNLYLITGNEEERVYPSELLLGDIIMTKDPEYPMRIITDISKNFHNGVFVSTTLTCTAVNSNDINDISQLKKDGEYFYQNSNSCVATANQDFGTKFGYVLLGTFNSSNSGSINIHATYGDSQKRSTIEMNVSFDSSGKPTGYYTGTEPNYDDGYCSLMTASTESDTSKLGLYMRLRGNVTYTIVINMPTPKNGGFEESKQPFSIVNKYTMIYKDSSWDPAKAQHWTTIYQGGMKNIGNDLLKITGSTGFNDTNWHYRKIGHFIFNSSDNRNGAPVHISGVIGTWAQEKMIFDIFVSTRGDLKVNGFVRGTNPSCRLVIDNTENPNIFLATQGFATYNITIDTFKNAQNENNAIRGSFHVDWTGEDDFTNSNSVTTNFGYQDLLSMVASQRASYAYTGSFSETSGTMTKLYEVKGEETGKIICVHGKATSSNSELSIQRRTSHYYDYDCIAVAPTGYSSGTYISCTGVVPPRLQYSKNTDSSVESSYYIFGKDVSEVYVITFDLP